MKVPEQAKLVFKGIIYDVYHWEQEQFDGTLKTFEMLKRPHTVEVIAVRGDKIIIARQQQPRMDPLYTLLGGRQDEGEEPLQTARRELREEGGLASEDWELYKTFEHESNKIDWTLHVFIARACMLIGKQTLDPGEKITLQEVSFDEFISIASTEQFWGGPIIKEVLRMRLEPQELEVFRKRLFG